MPPLPLTVWTALKTWLQANGTVSFLYIQDIPFQTTCYMYVIIMVNKGTPKRRAQWFVHPPKIMSANQNYNTCACSYTSIHVKFQNIILKILFIKKIRQLRVYTQQQWLPLPFLQLQCIPHPYTSHVHVVIITETHFQSCDSLDSIFECFHAYWRCFWTWFPWPAKYT